MADERNYFNLEDLSISELEALVKSVDASAMAANSAVSKKTPPDPYPVTTDNSPKDSESTAADESPTDTEIEEKLKLAVSKLTIRESKEKKERQYDPYPIDDKEINIHLEGKKIAQGPLKKYLAELQKTKQAQWKEERKEERAKYLAPIQAKHIAHYAELLKVKPNDPNILIAYGRILLKSRRAAEALPIFRQALKLTYESTLKNALSFFTPPTEQKKNLAKIHFYLGKTLDSLGRDKEALRQLELSQQLWPLQTTSQHIAVLQGKLLTKILPHF